MFVLCEIVPEVFFRVLLCFVTLPVTETFYYLGYPHPESGTLYNPALQSILITE